MKLYFSKGSCSLAVRIVINELNLPCEFISVNLKDKVTESGENYHNINPKGSVPVIETEDGQILTENNVIQQYLAEMHHATELLPAVGDFERYRVLEWSNYVSSELHKGFSPLFNAAIPQELKDSLFIPALKKKFEFVDARLKVSKYIAADHFTLPDAYMLVVLRWLGAFSIDIKKWPTLSRYFDELKLRPSIKLSMEQEGLS